MRTLKSQSILRIVNSYTIDSPQPSNLSYFWNFGSLLALCLILQILTGIFLAMHYTPNVELAFNSVEHIMRDVNSGWLIRYIHANVASFFFIFVYCHIGRALYYSGYKKPNILPYSIGVIILILMIGTGFLGYVLPYGQMSYWGATVITNLLSAIPVFGHDLVELIWGGFSVSNATLNRFFSLHYLLPFVLAALAVVHLLTLHENGSSNPLGISANEDRLPFHPYFLFKDLVTIFLFFLILSIIVCFYPNLLGHSDNYIPANPMSTPSSIVPEWYLLPFYAILRSIPNKLLGVIAMFGSLLILLILPLTDFTRVRSSQFRPFMKVLFWSLVVDFGILLWIGSCHPETPFVEIGQFATAFYFAWFIIFIPFMGLMENSLVDIVSSSKRDAKEKFIIKSSVGSLFEEAEASYKLTSSGLINYSNFTLLLPKITIFLLNINNKIKLFLKKIFFFIFDIYYFFLFSLKNLILFCKLFLITAYKDLIFYYMVSFALFFYFLSHYVLLAFYIFMYLNIILYLFISLIFGSINFFIDILNNISTLSYFWGVNNYLYLEIGDEVENFKNFPKIKGNMIFESSNANENNLSDMQDDSKPTETDQDSYIKAVNKAMKKHFNIFSVIRKDIGLSNYEDTVFQPLKFIFEHTDYFWGKSLKEFLSYLIPNMDFYVSRFWNDTESDALAMTLLDIIKSSLIDKNLHFSQPNPKWTPKVSADLMIMVTDLFGLNEVDGCNDNNEVVLELEYKLRKIYDLLPDNHKAEIDGISKISFIKYLEFNEVELEIEHNNLIKPIIDYRLTIYKARGVHPQLLSILAEPTVPLNNKK